MSKFYSLYVAFRRDKWNNNTTVLLPVYCMLGNMFIFIDFSVVFTSWQASCKGILVFS
jgi:hypothetical protein